MSSTTDVASVDMQTPAGPTRRNTFQQMLEVERIGKVNRMQASSSSNTPIHSRPASSQASLPALRPSPIPSLQSSGRAMTTPNLSIDIPPPKSKFVVKEGDIVPEDDSESDPELTAASSICHSPGWDDPATKKKKKEKEEAKKKKKEMEKAATKALAKSKADAKQAEKRNRLSKPRPATNRLSKIGFLMSRSASTPLVPPISEHIKTLSEEGKGGVLSGQSHNDVSKIPTAWKTAHGTPMEPVSMDESPLRQHPTSRSSFQHNDGFIGGLKLRLAEESETQEKAQRQSMTEEARIASATRSQQDFNFDIESRPVDASEVASSRSLTSSDTNSGRTPQQWESIYEQAARQMRSTDPTPTEVEESKSASQHGRRPRKTSYPPTSYFPEFLEETSTLRDPSTSSNNRNVSKPRISDEESSHRRPSSSYSSESQSQITRDTSFDREQSTERRQVPTQSYAGRQRKQGEDVALRDHDGENRGIQAVNLQPVSRGRRMSLTSIKNFVLSPNSGVSSANAAAARSQQGGSVPPRLQPLKEPAPRSTSRGDLVGSPAESRLHQRRSSSKSNMPAMQGIKDAARSVFTRNSTIISPSELISSSQESMTQQSRHRSQPSGSSSLSGNGRPGSKAERFFGQSITADMYTSPVDSCSLSSGNTSSPTISVESPGLDSGETLDTQHHGNSHTRSVTNSSEGYSTVDDSSAITTPMPSTSHSYHEQLPRIHDDDQVYDSAHDASHNSKQSYIMTNAMPPGTPKAPGTPYATSRPKISNAHVPNMPAVPSAAASLAVVDDSTGVTRQRSITRSVSTPELPQQDLSFLPVLKHQPLTRPSKSSKREEARILSERSIKAGPVKEPESSKHLLKHEASPQKAPISSQYLQNARLSMPRPPSRSGPPIPNQPGGADPIAKMFVVCCSCKYFHDMPSKIYECMARSESVVEDKDLGVSGVVSTSVRCPWCAHGMTTACCAGYAAVVVLREKLH